MASLRTVDYMGNSRIETGARAPLGATVQPGGVNFSVYSKNAEFVEVLLFDSEEATESTRVITLDARKRPNRAAWQIAGQL